MTIILQFGKKLKAITALLCIVVMLAQPVQASAQHNEYTADDIKNTIEDIVKWKKQSVKANGYLLSSLADTAGTTASDWYAFSVSRLGIDEDYFSYTEVLKNNVEEKYKTNDRLDKTKSTEWHRIALTALSLGADPTALGIDKNGKPINLIADGVYNKNDLAVQGVNGYIWALITLDSGGFTVPQNAVNTRESIINAILTYQLDSGGFAFDGTKDNVDITAMAITALSNYVDSDKKYTYKNKNGSKRTDTIKNVVNRSVKWLSEQQQENGDFSQDGVTCSESTAQAMVALCSAGIDPINDSRFIKNGNNILDGLMHYKKSDGGFAHIAGEGSNSIASEQALYALCALYRYSGGYNRLFDLTDVQQGRVNIFTNKKVETIVLFNEYDLEQYNSLPDELTTESYNAVLVLYQKLIKAQNADDYNNIKADLKDKLDSLNKIKTEIEDINSQIADKLYPFNNVTNSDRELVNSICNRVDKLSEYDQTQVLAIDDLRQAQARLNTSVTTVIVAVVVAAAVFLLVVILVVRRKKKKAKNDNENTDW